MTQGEKGNRPWWRFGRDRKAQPPQQPSGDQPATPQEEPFIFSDEDQAVNTLTQEYNLGGLALQRDAIEFAMQAVIGPQLGGANQETEYAYLKRFMNNPRLPEPPNHPQYTPTQAPVPTVPEPLLAAVVQARYNNSLRPPRVTPSGRGNEIEPADIAIHHDPHSRESIREITNEEKLAIIMNLVGKVIRENPNLDNLYFINPMTSEGNAVAKITRSGEQITDISIYTVTRRGPVSMTNQTRDVLAEGILAAVNYARFVEQYFDAIHRPL